jgi:hypothetical protein
MRPRFQGNPRLQHNRANEGYVRIDYEVDGFHGVQQYLFSRIDDPDEIHWDLITTIRNASGVDVSEYGQFFACYTPLNRRQSSYFWNSLGQLELWSERRVGHLNGYVASPNSWVQQDDRIPHCPRGGGRIVGEWKHPVLVSHASPDGRRFVLMIEEARCTAVAQGMEGNAMDYILYPEHTQRAFANDASFSVHIRHHIIKSPEPPEPDRLERLWKAFEESYKEAHRRAAKLR